MNTYIEYFPLFMVAVFTLALINTKRKHKKTKNLMTEIRQWFYYIAIQIWLGVGFTIACLD